MSTNITALLGGGTTETLNGSDYPVPDVVNLTQQIIAINNNAALTPIEKQNQIDALQGITFNAVNTNPQVDINGNLIQSTVTPQSTIDSVLQNLMNQLANPSDNPILQQSQTSPSQIVTPPVYVLPSLNIGGSDTAPVQPTTSQPVFTVGSTSGLSVWIKQNSLFIIIGIIFLLIMISARPSQRISYVRPQVLEAGR